MREQRRARVRPARRRASSSDCAGPRTPSTSRRCWRPPRPGGPTPPGWSTTSPIIEQSLADLVAWVEDGVEPLDMRFELIDGQIVLAPTAAERGGIQPVCDGHRQRCDRAAEVARRRDVDARGATPRCRRAPGRIIAVQWDFDGSGAYPRADRRRRHAERGHARPPRIATTSPARTSRPPWSSRTATATSTRRAGGSPTWPPPGSSRPELSSGRRGFPSRCRPEDDRSLGDDDPRLHYGSISGAPILMMPRGTLASPRPAG